jgi:hypothetical protein
MGFRGGDLKQLMVGNREVTPIQEGDFEYGIGGIEAEAHKSGNSVGYATGKMGQAHFSGPILGDSVNKLLEYLQGLEDAGDTIPLTFTKINNDTYAGSLYIVGQLREKRDGSIDLSLEGGKLEKI